MMLTCVGRRRLPEDCPEPLAKPPDCRLFATAEPLGLLWSPMRRDAAADAGDLPAGWRAVVRCCRCRVRALLAARRFWVHHISTQCGNKCRARFAV